MNPPSMQERIAAWSRVYATEGQRWGMLPSLTAHMALSDIDAAMPPSNGVLLDVGCGYGRDLLLFRSVFPHMTLDGIEPAEEATKLGKSVSRAFGLRRLFSEDVLKLRPVSPAQRYDVVFANYLVHLFSKTEAARLLTVLAKMLRSRGLLILSFVSVRDRHFGKGRRLDQNLYEVRKHMPWHFSDRKEAHALVNAAGLAVQTIRVYTEVELVRGARDPVEGIYVVATRRGD